MAKLEWEESWSVGNDTLDKEHMSLIIIINRVLAGEGPMEMVLRDLADYANNHFNREEGLMQSANYEELDAHKHEHHMFVEWVNEITTTLSRAPEARHLLGDTIHEYLQKWLKEHILNIDMAYKGKL